ncbi:MAG: TIR domain-containing protein [Gammaproteobacteria bacterium]|nr:TIR domain-containing protein [Gammaproteobacteria bacterium]
MAQIFISYSRQNEGVIKTLVKDLKVAKKEVWLDEALNGGQPWWDQILEKIRCCDIFIFAFSHDSRKSEACKRELGYAITLNKKVLPLRVDDVNPNLLPHGMSAIQCTDYLEQDKNSALAMMAEIAALSASAFVPPPDPLPPEPAVPLSYLGVIKDDVETGKMLSRDEQYALFYKIKSGVSEGHSLVEVRDYLLMLKQREDLLANVAEEVDAFLASIENELAQGQGHSKRDENFATPPSSQQSKSKTEKTVDIYCSKCGKGNSAVSKFCGNCGNLLHSETAGHTAPTHEKETERGGKSRRFVCPEQEYHRVIEDLNVWLEGQNYSCQRLTPEGGGVLLQVAQKGAWRKFVGMATALNILFHQEDNTVTVEIGAGKWLDKTAVGTVSLFILWPLAVTAGIGAWQQIKLPDKIFDYLGDRLVCA